MLLNVVAITLDLLSITDNIGVGFYSIGYHPFTHYHMCRMLVKITHSSSLFKKGNRSCKE